MSFLLEKKQEHESQCEAKARAGDYKNAVFHAAKAAEFAYALARQTEGDIQKRYLEDAEGWLDIGERLKEQKSEAQPGGARSGATAKTGQGAEEAAHDEAGSGEWQVEEKPDVTFDMIAGMQTAKQAIFEMIVFPLQQPEKTRAMGLKPGGGTLLYGPPGTGKTMLAKAIANQLDAPFFFASGADIRSKWHGESEQRLSSLLKEAQSHDLAVLFLDEVEALLPKRGSSGSVVDNRIVAQFLADVGGFSDSDNILLILGATNRPWDIDEAVFRTGRFDEKLYIPPPDREARLGILKMHLESVPTENGFSLEDWSDRLEGYTGSDIVGVVNAAKRSALGRCISTDSDPVLENSDFQEALDRIPSSLTAKSMSRYKKFREQRFK